MQPYNDGWPDRAEKLPAASRRLAFDATTWTRKGIKRCVDFIFLLVVVTLLLAGPERATAASNTPPNVLVVLLDDMGFSDLGCYGGEARTPNIDALAGNGVRFRNFHNTSRCSPTRMALLTGLYTHQAATVPGDSLPPLRTDNNITIPELLRLAGYRTYMAGKWHLGNNAAQIPRARGFQHVFGMGSTQSGAGADYWKRDAYSLGSENNEIAARSYGAGAYEFYQTDAIGDYAIDFLNHHAGKADGAKFFMYLPFNAPHFDIQVDKAYAEQAPAGGRSYLSIYSDGWDIVRSNRYERMLSMGVIHPLHLLAPFSDTPYNGDPAYQQAPRWQHLDAARKADLSRRMALYAAMIERVDDNVGRVVERLNALGQLTNTLVFVMSDNGCNAEGGMFGWARTGSETNKSNNHPALTGADLAEMGQPFRDDKLSIGGGWANVGNTPYRMYKRYSHGGGIRTPLIVHWPAGITNPGRWTEQTGHLIDIMATVADVTGAGYPAAYGGHPVLPMEGRSLAPALRQEAAFDRTLGFEHESTRAWIDGHWKLVTKTAASTDGSSLANSIELYDLSTDPTELNNLAPGNPDRAAAMVAAWNTWAARVGVPASRLLPPAFNPTPVVQPADLFLDTFARPDSVDTDAGAGGMSGSRVPPIGVGNAYYEGFEGSDLPDSIHILTGRMRVAVGIGMAENGIKHNFVGQDIVDAGGFSVSMNIRAIETATGDSTNRYIGFGVGLTQAEASTGADISKAGSFRGSEANPIGRADFFVELDINRNVKVWRKGQLLASVPVGATNGTLTASFALNGFSTSSTVAVNVFFNGRLLDIHPADQGLTSQSFSWDNNNANYIGISARATIYSEIDNLAIRKLPLAPALASEYALEAGLTVPDSGTGADPDADGDSNMEEWLKGGQPGLADASRQLLAVTSVSAGELRFSYYRLAAAVQAGVRYRFQASTNLVDWTVFTPEQITVQPEPTGYERVECRVPGSLAEGRNALFILLETHGPGISSVVRPAEIARPAGSLQRRPDAMHIVMILERLQKLARFSPLLLG